MRAFKHARSGERWMLASLVCGLVLVFAQLCVLAANHGKGPVGVPQFRKGLVAFSAKVDRTLHRIRGRL